MKLVILSLMVSGQPKLTVYEYPTARECQMAKGKVINRLGRQLWKGCVK